MKLHGELTARAILGQWPRTYHRRIGRAVFVHRSTTRPLDDPPTRVASSAVGGLSELLMAEQAHSPTLDRAELRRVQESGTACAC